MFAERRLAFEAAQRRWPGLGIGLDAFCAHLSALGWIEKDPVELDSVLLCCACAAGSEAACAILDRDYLSQARPAVIRIDRRPEFVEEVLQLVRCKLLTGKRPQIASYTGRGPLVAWLRVVAARAALDERRLSQKPLRQAPRLASELGAAPTVDLERALIKRDYAPVCEQALKGALDDLTLRERGILRLYLVQKLNIDAIGRVYGVHRATVARWLAQAREKLLVDMKSKLEIELGALQRGEFDSLLGTVKSDLDLDLVQLLDSGWGDCDDVNSQ